jgi:hypothetical protein
MSSVEPQPTSAPEQPIVVVSGFTDAPNAAAAGNTAVIDRPQGIVPVPLANRGCLVGSCGIGCSIFLQLSFAFANAFWMLWTSTGTQVFRGYSWIVASLYVLAGLETVAVCAEVGSSRTQAAYALSAVGCAASSLSAAVLVAFLVAVRLDYGTKCDEYKLLEDRVLSAAYPYNCGDGTGGPLLAIWTGVYIVGLVLMPKVTLACFACARCGWHRSDYSVAKAAATGGLQQPLLRGSNQVPQAADPAATRATCTHRDLVPSLLLAVAVATAVATATAGLFISAQRPAPEGSCPGSQGSNFTSDPEARRLAELLFRPEPLLGSELPECGWRSEQGGSCIRYPINPSGLNRSVLADPTSGRFVPDLSSSTTNDTCATLLGLYSCSVYSPEAGKFVRGLSLNTQDACPGDELQCSTIVFSIAICSSFCDELWAACNTDSSAFCYGATSGEDCCKRLGDGVSVVDGNATEGDDCYNAAPHTRPWVAALGFSVVASFTVAM